MFLWVCLAWATRLFNKPGLILLSTLTFLWLPSRPLDMSDYPPWDRNQRSQTSSYVLSHLRTVWNSAEQHQGRRRLILYLRNLQNTAVIKLTTAKSKCDFPSVTYWKLLILKALRVCLYPWKKKAKEITEGQTNKRSSISTFSTYRRRFLR